MFAEKTQTMCLMSVAFWCYTCFELFCVFVSVQAILAWCP